MTTETSSAPEAPSTFDSVADAVAELDRREAVRAEQRAAERAEKAAQPQAEAATEQVSEHVEGHEEPDADTPAPEEEGIDAPDEVATEEEVKDEPHETSTVVLDGKEIEIPKGTPRALVEGIKKLESDFRADYTRKTQEVAAERQQVVAAHQQTSQLAQQLQQAQATLAQFYQAAIGEPPPPLESARTDDEFRAILVQRDLHARRLQQYQELMQVGHGLTAQQQQATKQAQEQYLAEQYQRAAKSIPELNDPAKSGEFIQRISKAAEAYGVTPQEFAQISDHRMWLMLRDIAKLQGREQVAGSVKQKLANVPPKVAKPGNASQDSGKGQKQAQAKQQFMRSGKSMRDVARYLAQTE